MSFSEKDKSVAYQDALFTEQLPWRLESPFSSIDDSITSATAIIPGSAGELAQGQLTEGEDFLVTNPIARFSEVRVCVRAGHGLITTWPSDRVKARQAILATLKLLKREHLDVYAHINSDIPLGKGMASSSADIVATIEATSAACGQSVTQEQISAIAISIEPSDGLMHRGTVIYNHRRGQLIEALGPPPSMRQLILDTGGVVDTLEFNKPPKVYTSAETEQLLEALQLIREGIKTANLAKIGRASTISAKINQRFLPKHELEIVEQLAHKCNAHGIICAHSGTILSLLFDPDNLSGIEKALKLLQSSSYSYFQTYSVCSW